MVTALVEASKQRRVTNGVEVAVHDFWCATSRGKSPCTLGSPSSSSSFTPTRIFIRCSSCTVLQPQFGHNEAEISPISAKRDADHAYHSTVEPAVVEESVEESVEVVVPAAEDHDGGEHDDQCGNCRE